jgi:hypothetical protein
MCTRSCEGRGMRDGVNIGGLADRAVGDQPPQAPDDHATKPAVGAATIAIGRQSQGIFVNI